MANRFEEMVRGTLEGKGWKVLRSGWPDFLCCKKKPNGEWEYQAVEVKSCGDDVRPNQQDMLFSLANVMPTLIYHQTKGGSIYKESVRWWLSPLYKPDFDGLGVS